jgi:hypothetical protein
VRSVNTADIVVTSNVSADNSNGAVQTLTSGSSDSAEICNVLSANRASKYKIH